MNGKKCYDSIIDVIGNTPLVRLNHVAATFPARSSPSWSS